MRPQSLKRAFCVPFGLAGSAVQKTSNRTRKKAQPPRVTGEAKEERRRTGRADEGDGRPTQEAPSRTRRPSARRFRKAIKREVPPTRPEAGGPRQAGPAAAVIEIDGRTARARARGGPAGAETTCDEASGARGKADTGNAERARAAPSALLIAGLLSWLRSDHVGWSSFFRNHRSVAGADRPVAPEAPSVIYPGRWHLCAALL